jgi:helicase
VSQQAASVETLFCHGVGDEFLVAARRDGERVLRARLELVERDAGPRPGKFRRRTPSGEEPRQPDEFVDLARGADAIRISEQTPRVQRSRLQEMLSAYQLDAKAVRTCRRCAERGEYSPITSDSAIDAGEEHICRACAAQELHQETAYRGDLSDAALDRLEDLLYDVGDLERITNLLRGGLDPDLTKVDEMSPTVEAVDPVPVADIDVHPDLAASLESRFDELLPVQSLAVANGLLDGEDQLLVSATATGKTLVGEIAGIDRALRGDGKLLFLVPLVALANQKHGDFQEDYGDLVDVTIRVGGSRIGGSGAAFDPSADVIVGTYEGIDHALRTGRDLGDIGTVVIDEVHTLGDADRGHRLDGLITRLKHYCETEQANRAQWLYLSATVGNPGELGAALDARPIEFEERPVPIERHVAFADGHKKPTVTDRLVKREFDRVSPQGYRGQTIVFTNSRRRCHTLARKLEYDAAPYHAGLDYGKRKSVERQFADGDIAAVITTAALAAGVDFPASQVIFDSLAMGIEWLSAQEFHQMLGRAGRPDYHDRGVVYLLVEPDGTYHGSHDRTEDEVAFHLLNDDPEAVTPAYDGPIAVEETLANVTVGGDATKRCNDRMVGDMPTKYALGKLIEYEFIDGLEPTPLGRAVTRHFLAPDDAFRILEALRRGDSPDDIVTAMELADDEL